MQSTADNDTQLIGEMEAFLDTLGVERAPWRHDLVQELLGVLEQLGLGDDVKRSAALFYSVAPSEAVAQSIGKAYGEEAASVYRQLLKVTEMGAVIAATGPEAGGKGQQSGDGRQMMLLSMIEDVRAVFILLAHQLCVMRGIKNETEDTKAAHAREVQQLWAPLANRLGIGRIKWELEDLAFRYLESATYKDIAGKLEARRVDREKYIAEAVSQLKAALTEAGIDAEVYGRPKHIYSIWRKMQQKHKAFHELYDVRAVRVMVDDLQACYAALGVVHALWQYIPGEYDDYIAAPKANMYQSLHTAVVGPEGQTLEVQIRSRDMHQHAELGVAAHWRYKEGGRRDPGLERRIERIRQLLAGEAPTETARPSDEEDRVYVLTPKGNVVELPGGATPLDFAYRVHTEVGHRCRGAKINGKMVTLTTPLESGQEVDIITGREAMPSRDWLVPHLGYLHTAGARAKVRQWFKKQFRDEDIAAGKVALAREFTRAGIETHPLDGLARRFNFDNDDDLLAAVGRGEIGPAQTVNAWKDLNSAPPELDQLPTVKPPSTKARGEVVVLGVTDLMTSMARCCQPLPGDAVVGYITRGRGISVHRSNCRNLKRLVRENPDRLVDVSWGTAENRYEADIEIEARDRAGLLRDVTSVLSGEDINVYRANTHTNKQTQVARMRLSLEVGNSQQLERALRKLTQVKNVFNAFRVR